MTSHEHDDDRAAQYVAGTMSASEVEEFEQHLLMCETCRTAVRLGAATRAALLADAGDRGVQRSGFGRLARLRLPWVAAAAVIVVMVVATRGVSRTEPLGSIMPAPFFPGALRTSMNSVTALVDSGMLAYSAADYVGAAEQLERAVRHDSSAAVRLFLGVSLLMRGHDESAQRHLNRVPAESPYGAEAAYYEAKVWVRLRQWDSAHAVVKRTASTGSMSAALRAFADSLSPR